MYEANIINMQLRIEIQLTGVQGVCPRPKNRAYIVPRLGT